MAAVKVGLCSFPLFNFAFTLPGLPSFSLPIINFDFSIDLSCPLNED